jgi:hypothetical protein
MSYQILQDDFYIQNITLPGGIPGVQRYGLRYDSTTGDYVVSQKSAAGYTITIAAATLIQNGSFTSDAVRDSLLFTNNDVNQPTQKAKDLLLDVNRKVNAAYQKLGGSNKGNKINPAALPANQGRFVVNNAAAGASAGISSIGGPLALPPGQGNIFDDINLDDFGTKNMSDLFKDEDGLLRYPIDIIKDRQDILKITQYQYQAPYGDVFEGKQNETIFKNGAQRQSALKSLIATIILPIPNNISDSNGVNWGDGDQMNSVAMGVAGNMGAVAGSVLATKAGALFAAAKGSPELANILNSSGAANVATLLTTGGLINPTTKAALFSKILKAADFDISPETILSRGYGVVANSNLELLFSGPMLRGFQFGYVLSPRSEKEAIMCRKIIRFFKQGMAAKKSNKTGGGAGASSFLLATPNVFKLQYKTFGKDGKQKDIAGLNKFKICALTNIKTSYADGQWAAFDEGQPVRYQIELSFKELEPIYESDYQDKLSDSLNGTINGKYEDQPSVGKDEIGF